jgi:hypothetical protein
MCSNERSLMQFVIVIRGCQGARPRDKRWQRAADPSYPSPVPAQRDRLRATAHIPVTAEAD